MAQEEEKKPQETRPVARPISIPIDMNLIYVNGGNIGLSPTEVQLTATVNGRPHTLMLMPFPVAKSLANGILKAISDYEEKTGIKINDLSEVVATLKK